MIEIVLIEFYIVMKFLDVVQLGNIDTNQASDESKSIYISDAESN